MNRFKGLEKLKTKEFYSKNAIYIVLIVLIVVIAIKDPRFLSLTCFSDILKQNSTRLIIALGTSFVIMTGGTDLSAGRMVGFAAVLSASMVQTADYSRRFYPNMPQISVIIPILIAIAVGICLGFLNGTIVSRFNVPPFIATLGTMVIVYGANSIYFDLHPNDSQPIAGLRSEFTNLGSGNIKIFGYQTNIPIIVVIAIAIAIVVWIVFNKTKLGKNMYAIGGNPEAAKVSGINVAKTLTLLYVIAGSLYAVGGILEAARTGGATNNYGNMYELDAIAACVVGGVSVAGGIGTVPGIVAGVLIFGVINYGLTFIGVNPYWQLIIKGLIIVVAVAFDIRKYIAKK